MERRYNVSLSLDRALVVGHQPRGYYVRLVDVGQARFLTPRFDITDTKLESLYRGDGLAIVRGPMPEPVPDAPYLHISTGDGKLLVWFERQKHVGKTVELRSALIPLLGYKPSDSDPFWRSEEYLAEVLRYYGVEQANRTRGYMGLPPVDAPGIALGS